MKRKLNILCNVVIICLCIGALTLGVYSAKSANSSISSYIGFKTYNATVSLDGTIKNVAQVENSYIVSKKDISFKTSVDSNTTFSLGELYFYSNNNNYSAQNIVIELKFTNAGDSEIIGKVTKPTLGSTRVSVVSGSSNGYTTFDSNNTYSFALNPSNSHTVSFALKLGSTSSNLSTSACTFTLPVEFSQHESLLKTGEFTSGSTTVTRSYYEFGTINSSPLRWFLFASNASGSFSAVTSSVTANADGSKPLASGRYWFICENVFTPNNGTNDLNFSNSNSNNQYNNSNIVNYLKNRFFNDIGLNPDKIEENEVYNLINSASVTDLMINQISNGLLVNDEYYLEECAALSSQKLWLPSVSDLTFLNNATITVSMEPSMYPKLKAKNSGGNFATYWTRSPTSDSLVFLVDSDGYLGYEMPTTVQGVRPAFEVVVS